MKQNIDPVDQLNKNNKIKESLAQTKLRRKTQVCKVVTVKIQTNKLNLNQKEALKMLFIESKWIKNEMLNYSKDGKDIFDYEPQKTVKVLNKDKEFEQRELKYIGSQQIQSVVTDVKNSIKALSASKQAGNKVGSLKFVSEYKAINLKQYGITYKIKSSNRMKIQGIPGHVYVRGLEQLNRYEDYEIANAKLLCKPDGYYVAITVYVNENEIQDDFVPGSKIGLDMGVKTNITLSDGKEINVFVEESERLKTLQKKLARQKDGSNNKWKTIKKIRKEYLKMDNSKEDISNKIVSDLKQYETIYFQDENLKAWKKKGSKANGSKKIHHSILGRVKSKLKKLDRIYMHDKWVATTQTCYCGRKNKLELSDRIYSCECGYSAPRDVHSANMMIFLGDKAIDAERIESTPVETLTSAHLRARKSESMKQEASESLVQR